MNETNDNESSPASGPPEEITRRRFFEKLSVALGGLCAAVLGVPVVGFVSRRYFARRLTNGFPSARSRISKSARR